MNMRTLLGWYLTLCLAGLTFGQEAAQPPSAEVMQKLQEAQELQQRQRYVDALAKLDELEALNPNVPDLYNMRGSIFLSPSLRDFEKAQEMFEKADSLEPGSLAVRFNKSELLFVKHDWQGSLAGFDQILTDFPKLPLQVRHLVLFKKLVSELKLDRVAEAEKTLSSHFTFMDDTPAYYFSKAAIAFQKKDEAAAQDWLQRAAGIFKEGESSAYGDTLMEARWLPNIGLPVQTKP